MSRFQHNLFYLSHSFFDKEDLIIGMKHYFVRILLSTFLHFSEIHHPLGMNFLKVDLIFYKRKMVYQHNMSQLSNILSNELKCISADIVNNIILHYLDVQTQKIICESNVRLKWLISQKNNLRLIKYNKI